eukprot:216879-Pelagomonas_calceolata.AAC.1
MSSAWRWVLIRIGLRVCSDIRERQDALSEAMSVCPCWSATRMPASYALLIVFVGPCPLGFMCNCTWDD